DVLLMAERGLLAMQGSVYDPESLTFCESSKRDFAMIRARLTNAKDVCMLFEDLVGTDQLNVNEIIIRRKLFPYDVINLDFEEPPFILRRRARSRPLEAINKVFQLQRRHGRSFSLFVTFPAEDAQVDDNGRVMLSEIIGNNLTQGTEEFRAAYLERFGSEGIPTTTLESTLIVVPKVIVAAGADESFEVTCTHRLTYVGRPTTNTRMVAFVFDCEYQGTSAAQPGLLGLLDGHYAAEVVRLVRDATVDVNIALEGLDGSLEGVSLREDQEEIGTS
ncbi:MAG: hypothetical protein AAB288_05150, partial [Acidobacteriota bacterium]